MKEEQSSLINAEQEPQANYELVNFENNAANDGKSEELLGELLSHLRKNKQMSLLMLCRQIDKLEAKDGIAEIYSDRYDLTELLSNENHKSSLDKFFKSRNLSFKIKENQKQIDPLAELKQMFGDKLIVK